MGRVINLVSDNALQTVAPSGIDAIENILAAEAVVAAASWVRMARGIAPFSPAEHLSLVEAVCEDPSLTASLLCVDNLH